MKRSPRPMRRSKQAQSALIEKEKLEHELEIAQEIQKSILPKEIPDVPGWQIAAHWQPARAVSGDFYDILPFPDGRLGLLIADVSGKGVPAALVMATTCSILRGWLAQKPLPPRRWSRSIGCFALIRLATCS